jgi:hypothetical protein
MHAFKASIHPCILLLCAIRVVLHVLLGTLSKYALQLSQSQVCFQQVLTFLLCFSVVICVLLQVPPDMPLEYSLLMRSCWDGDSAKRPTFAQVIQCLELLLDNLTSDSDGRISEGSEGAQSTSSNSGKGGNASGNNASSVTLEELLARKSEPAAAAAASGALPAESACGGKDSSGAASSRAAAAAADIAAGRPGGMISSSRLPVASGSGLGAGTPGAPPRSDQQQELQLVALPDKALSERVPSIGSSRAALSSASLLGTGSRAGQTGGTWSSSLGGSGSLGSALGVPATPQQPAVAQQQGAWQQVGRFGLRGQQQAEPGSGSKDDADRFPLVQDLWGGGWTEG